MLVRLSHHYPQGFNIVRLLDWTIYAACNLQDGPLLRLLGHMNISSRVASPFRGPICIACMKKLGRLCKNKSTCEN